MPQIAAQQVQALKTHLGCVAVLQLRQARSSRCALLRQLCLQPRALRPAGIQLSAQPSGEPHARTGMRSFSLASRSGLPHWLAFPAGIQIWAFPAGIQIWAAHWHSAQLAFRSGLFQPASRSGLHIGTQGFPKARAHSGTCGFCLGHILELSPIGTQGFPKARAHSGTCGSLPGACLLPEWLLPAAPAAHWPCT